MLWHTELSTYVSLLSSLRLCVIKIFRPLISFHWLYTSVSTGFGDAIHAFLPVSALLHFLTSLWPWFSRQGRRLIQGQGQGQRLSSVEDWVTCYITTAIDWRLTLYVTAVTRLIRRSRRSTLEPSATDLSLSHIWNSVKSLAPVGNFAAWAWSESSRLVNHRCNGLWSCE